jgi:hypothetical protein
MTQRYHRITYNRCYYKNKILPNKMVRTCKKDELGYIPKTLLKQKPTVKRSRKTTEEMERPICTIASTLHISKLI